MNIADIIKRPIITEKSQVAKTKMKELYFQVDVRANKLEIGRAFETMFEGIKIDSVRTKVKKSILKVKKGVKTKTSREKVAMVRFKEGSIEV
jgi:large subunit ribosomal protein L23